MLRSKGTLVVAFCGPGSGNKKLCVHNNVHSLPHCWNAKESAAKCHNCLFGRELSLQVKTETKIRLVIWNLFVCVRRTAKKKRKRRFDVRLTANGCNECDYVTKMLGEKKGHALLLWGTYIQSDT